MQVFVEQLIDDGWEQVEETLKEHKKFDVWHEKACRIYDELISSNDKFEHRPYQPEQAALYSMRRFNICNGDLGLGKTVQSALVIATVYDEIKTARPGTVHIAVTSRDAAITRWIPDIEAISRLEGLVEFIDTESKLLKSKAPIWIYIHDFPKNRSKKCSRKAHPYICELMLKTSRHPSLLIIDEIHCISKKTKRHKHLDRLCGVAKRKLGLSGTLSDGRMEKIHTALDLIYKRRIDKTSSQFVSYFNNHSKVATNYLKGEEEESDIEVQDRYLAGLAISKIPEYSSLTRALFHRTKISDPEISAVCSVPVGNFLFHPIEMSGKQQEIYSQVMHQLHPEIKKLIEYGTGKDRLKAMSLSQKLKTASSAPWIYDLDVVCNKYIKLEEIAEEARESKRKLVVFTNMIPVGGYVEDKLVSKFGRESVVRIYASDENATPKILPKHERTERLQSLMYGEDCQFGIFNIKLTNNSIDLTNVGILVFWDIPWETIWVEQAIKRAVRPGSIHKEIDVHFLSNQKTIDVHQTNLLVQKSKKLNILQDFDVLEVSQDSVGQMDPLLILKQLEAT
jgi:superfamily II DNA or RNA helicase